MLPVTAAVTLLSRVLSASATATWIEPPLPMEPPTATATFRAKTVWVFFAVTSTVAPVPSHAFVVAFRTPEQTSEPPLTSASTSVATTLLISETATPTEIA